MSEEIDKAKEIQHVKQAFRANNYPDWMLTIPKTGSVPSRISEESVKQKENLRFSSMHQGNFGAPPMSIFLFLNTCPPEDQAEVMHAISPISAKLGQTEGHAK